MPVWLSYRCFGSVIQSEIFSISEDIEPANRFHPMTNAFRIRGSLPELDWYLKKKKNSMLRIHLCKEGEVLGTSSVDLRQLTALENDGNDFEGRVVQNEYVVKPRGGVEEETQRPRLCVRLGIDRDLTHAIPGHDSRVLLESNQRERNSAAVYTSMSSQTSKRESVDRGSSPMRRASAVDEDVCGTNDCHSTAHGEKKEAQIKDRKAELTSKERAVYEAMASLEKKKCEWEQWRHRQEVEWHEKLRCKEDAAMRVIEERVSKIEKERLSSMDASKGEYEKMEARLRKALIDVEAKERLLRDTELGYQNQCKRKLAELELREKLAREELKHSIEIERAKVNAAVEQAVASEKLAAAANKRVKQIENEMDHLREEQRKTPEVTLMHQVAELKGQLAENERRLESERAEKNKVFAEKERFRSDVHKLARALRQEREKALAKRQSNNQEVRLSYDANDKSFVLDGGQAEVQRILADLSRISQAKGQDPMTTPARNMGELEISNDVPMPSPPPPRPSPGGYSQLSDCINSVKIRTPG
ncbi:hypothetical protein ACHAWF_009025 [Thalassiosira exigua]